MVSSSSERERARLSVAVVETDSLGGIARMVSELTCRWVDHGIDLRGATMSWWRSPLAGNIPRRIDVPAASRTVFLPKISGASALIRTTGLVRVATVHDLGCLDCPEDRSLMLPPARWNITREIRALRHMDVIVTVSEFTRGAVLRHLPGIDPERVHVIGHGVAQDLLQADRSDRPQESRRRVLERLKKPGANGPLLLYVGDEAPRKNFPLLVDVVRRLKPTFPELTLVKVGASAVSAGRRRTLDAMKRTGLAQGPDIVFAGRISDQDLGDFYRAADVYVTASLYEGFGLPPLEALAAGTPVVATALGAHREVLADQATLVRPTVADFSVGVLHVLSSPRRVRAVDARRRYAARFQWQTSARQYVDLFTQAGEHEAPVSRGLSSSKD